MAKPTGMMMTTKQMMAGMSGTPMTATGKAKKKAMKKKGKK